MFKFLEDAIENTLDVVGGALSGEDVTKQQISKLVSDGLSIAAICAATGLAVEVVEGIMGECDGGDEVDAD